MIKTITEKINIDWKKVLVICLITLIMASAYYSNFINQNNQLLERIWKSEGIERIVVGKILADNMGLEVGKFGMGSLVEIPDPVNESEISYVYDPYISHFGVQGFLFSFIYNTIGIQRLGALRLLNASLLAFTLSIICYYLQKKFGFAYAAIFYGVSLLSPWLTAFSRNLYWMAWSWFLPMLVGLLISIDINNYKKFLPWVFLAVLFKSLCSNDYITTVMLSGISFLVISFFMEKNRESRVKIIKVTLIVGVVALLAFCLSLIIHASIRGETIGEGLVSIYQRDILRRTIGGNPDDFDPKYRSSIRASVWNVLWIYIFDWHTDVIAGVPGRRWFPILFFASLAGSLVYIFDKSKRNYTFTAMFIMFFAASSSFYILGKSHSYIHVAFNYVLWYFGFAQFLFFMLIKLLKDYFPTRAKLIRDFTESL